MAKIVIALGGNALGKTPIEQRQAVKDTAKNIVGLVENGHDIVFTHGNGPQVGMINLAFETSANTAESIPEMPFPECGAMSQGYIGYHLQNAMQEKLKEKDIEKNVATIVSQIVVDKNDSAFEQPTKPVGAFYSSEEAEKLKEEKGYNMVEDSGRGYRRVVPSPLPVDIAEKDVIGTIVNTGDIVIACGGGGIPVIRENESLKGVSAVIDKDHASMLLAKELNFDYLVILTAVEKVALNFGTPDEEWLDEISVSEAKKYCREGHFAEGSMLPKVEAAINFAQSGDNKKALITSLKKAKAGLEGKTGTWIKN